MDSYEIWSGEYDLLNDDDGYEVESAPLKHDTPAVKFDSLIENLKTETNTFKQMIISVAFTIIAIGMVLNLLFNLLVLCRKRSRQTTTTIIMLTMSLTYVVYLALYALKVTVYLEGDNITKFHMYDIVDNWTHGQFMCRFTSSLPVFVKLIVRLSILCIALKRFVKVFVCDCVLDNQSEDEQDMLEDHASNLSKTVDYGMQHMRKSSTISSTDNKSKSSKLRLILKCFEWPGLLVLIATIWALSFGATLPLFSSYQITRPVQNPDLAMCNSVFKFPEELSLVKTLYFNYLVYGTLIPTVLTCLILLLIFSFQVQCCRMGQDKSFAKTNSPKIGHNTTTNSSSSSSTSFTEDSTSNHEASCIRRSSENNCLLWLMLVVHLATSLPQELYRYNQLSINFNDKNVLDEYLTSTLTEPLLKATPYYSFQLLYLAETVVMPALFILFLVGSMKRERPTRSDSDLNKKKCACSQSHRFRFMRRLFYDSELSESKRNGSFLKIYRRTAKPAAKHIFLPADQIGIENQEIDEARFPIVIPQKTGVNKIRMQAPKANFNQCNNNVMHIIQHPSWRINIKSQQQQQGETQPDQQQQQIRKQKASKHGVQLIGLN